MVLGITGPYQRKAACISSYIEIQVPEGGNHRQSRTEGYKDKSPEYPRKLKLKAAAKIARERDQLR